MLKRILTIIFIISLNSFAQHQVNHNYRILFKQDCNLIDAEKMLYETYAKIAGNDKLRDLIIEDVQFNFGKIVISLDEKPTMKQIDNLLQGKNLVSYEIIIFKNMYQELYERSYNLNGKFNMKNYQLILKYNNKVNAEEEINFLYEVFGKNDFLFEKDENILVLSIPQQNSELFFTNIKQNDKIVNIQEI